MHPIITGLHHIASVGSSAERTLDFYTGALGLRIVKRTVNFDNTEELCFYCGYEQKNHSGLISFFIREGAAPGRAGTGQIAAVTFSIPRHSMQRWKERLTAKGVQVEGSAWAFGEEHLCFTDPDGLQLALVEAADDADVVIAEQSEPSFAIVGVRSVEIQIEGYEHIACLLVDGLGLEASGRDGSIFRFTERTSASAVAVDLFCAPNAEPGVPGPGIAHHVAWQVRDENALKDMRAALVDRGCDITPALDRYYYRAAYFRAPEGIRFALATEGPGFLIDEPAASLGSSFKLPPWLQSTGGGRTSRSVKRRS